MHPFTNLHPQPSLPIIPSLNLTPPNIPTSTHTLLLLHNQSSGSEHDLRKQGLTVIIQIEALRDESQDGHFRVKGMMEKPENIYIVRCRQ